MHNYVLSFTCFFILYIYILKKNLLATKKIRKTILYFNYSKTFSNKIKWKDLMDENFGDKA